MALSDHVSFNDIQAEYGISDKQVKTLMRDTLKSSNYKTWRKRVRDRVGGVEGCTHIVEMLGPVATTAFQTIYPLKNKEQPEGERASTRPPRLLNTCHAFRSDGPKVKEFWPDHYDGPAGD